MSRFFLAGRAAVDAAVTFRTVVPQQFRMMSSLSSSGTLKATEVRGRVFDAMRKKYFLDNKYAQLYVQEMGRDASKMLSDHTAIRLNGVEGLLSASKLLYALQMEAHEDAESKGFKAALEAGLKSGDLSALSTMSWPYRFKDKALRSTHFDVVGSAKGNEQKIFVSLVDETVFTEEAVKKAIEEDRRNFANAFSAEGKALIAKLEKEGHLTEAESQKLVDDWMNNFSKRQIPIKLSTFEAMKQGKLEEGIKNPLPAIAAIGAAFSGVRNHHTLMEEEGDDIAHLPGKLKAMGVPPGSPPVQFDGPIVQTSSMGIPQEMEYLDDADVEDGIAIDTILGSDKSVEEKRKELQDLGLIKTKTVNHEYVEYIKRAVVAKVEVDGEEKLMHVWIRDGKCYSAERADQDYEGLQAGKYENGFDSYKKEVALKEVLIGEDGQVVRASGFKAANATNIFLGTRESDEKSKDVSAPTSSFQPKAKDLTRPASKGLGAESCTVS